MQEVTDMTRQYEFEQLNKAKGFHWFSKDTMRFWKTRVSNWDCISGLFITSEQPPSGPRKYTLRKADFESGQVLTIGEFCAYNTIGAAKTALRNAQRGK
jgi:hypothetical protein